MSYKPKPLQPATADAAIVAGELAPPRRYPRETVYPVDIVCLTNLSDYPYFSVIILDQLEGYRLIVTRRTYRFIDKNYSTLDEAKKAYDYFSSEVRLTPGVRPRWSGVYRPSRSWVEQRLNLPMLPGAAQAR
jgi:hypothetical protein